jgi:lysozyme
MKRFAVVFALVSSGCVGAAPIDVGSESSELAVCAKGPVVKGVDISHYDGTIDWTKVKADGIVFAFMKATESTGFVDPTFAANLKNARAAGVIPGAYHFFRPAADATAQADFFVQTAGVPAAGDLPLTIDLEATDNVASATVVSSVMTFLARVEEKTGRKPIVYTSARFLGTIGNPSGLGAYTLWVANWQVSCPAIPTSSWSDWTFWQDSATGTFAGIPATAVDTDQFNGSLADLQAWINGGSGGSGGGGGAGGGGGSGGGGGTGSVDGGTSDDGGSDGTGGNGDDGSGKGDQPAPTPQHSGCSFVAGGVAATPTALLGFLVFVSVAGVRARVAARARTRRQSRRR